MNPSHPQFVKLEFNKRSWLAHGVAASGDTESMRLRVGSRHVELVVTAHEDGTAEVSLFDVGQA